MLTTRPPVALLLGLSSLLALGGCGDKKAATIDAPVVKILDAAIDATPDAPPCATQVCGGVCVDTATDPMHCGSCTNVCQSGASCVGATPACTCPGAFLAADHPASGTDIFQVAGGIQIAIGLENGGGGLNGLVVGYVPATVQLNHAYDLAGAAVGTPPLVAAGYHFSVATMLPESAFYATAGTLTFTQACATGARGTVTGATFQAVASLTNPTIDPAGCSFTMAKLTFALGTACP